MTLVLDDPLRAARRAVNGGRFRDAWDALRGQPDAVRRGPEWLLLSAMARWRLGEFGPSRGAALEARDAYRRIGDVDGEMRAENVAAAGAFALGALGEAEQGFERALRLAEELGDELMLARCANNRGNVAFYLAKNSTALGFYRLAQALFERVGMRHGAAETWINIGLVWRDLERLRDSHEAAERALEIAEHIDQPRLIAQSLAMRGEALALSGDLPLGRAQVALALSLARQQEDRLAQVEALRILACIERLAGALAGAEPRAREALAIAVEIDHPNAIAEVERDLATILAAAGRVDEAAAALHHAAACYDRLGSAERARRTRERAEALLRPPAA